MSNGKQQGVVKFFNDQKGFGFISPNGGGDDVFVHITALKKARLDTLLEGQVVQFDVEPSERKPGKMCAVNVAVIG